METLRGLRLQSGKTVAEVANALGVTNRAIYNYEHGIRSIDICTAWSLANLYGCPIDEFVEAYTNTRRKAQEDSLS